MSGRFPLAFALSLSACSSDRPAETTASATTAASASPSASAASDNTDPRTPNQHYARGTPTFIAGTLGDDHEDRSIRGQIELVSGMLFPTAKVVDDTTIDVKGGPSAWPPNPVLYGGPQHNAVLAALATQLPFRMTSDSLEVDGHTVKGAGVQLITLVPARSGALSHPSFMLYAGTGPEGVAEINGMPHGESEIAIYDAFGSVAAGSWQRAETGFTPQLNWAPARQPLEDRDIQLGAAPATIKLTLSTVKGATYDDLPKKQEAISRGLANAVKKLEIDVPTDVRVVLYPDAEAKKTFTHSAGDGHAAPAARTLHVVAFDAKPLERLIAHEATHVYTHQAWGPPGTSFMGEGLAVWVSGQYGGVELADWKKKLAKRSPLTTLLGAQFRRLPERETYPQAGLVVGEIVTGPGLATLRKELWSATPDRWQAACERAGISMDQLAKASR